MGAELTGKNVSDLSEGELPSWAGIQASGTVQRLPAGLFFSYAADHSTAPE